MDAPHSRLTHTQNIPSVMVDLIICLKRQVVCNDDVVYWSASASVYLHGRGLPQNDWIAAPSLVMKVL